MRASGSVFEMNGKGHGGKVSIRESLSLSLSSVGHLTCGGLAVVIWWGPCRLLVIGHPLLHLLSSSVIVTVVVVTWWWRCHHHHLTMVVAWPRACQHCCDSYYCGSTGSTSSLGCNGGIMLRWWYDPGDLGHITIIVMTSHCKQGGPRGAVVGMTRMLLSLLHCDGGMAWCMSLSQGGRSGSGCVVTTLLHKGNSGHVLGTSVVLLPCWDRVW